MGIRGHIQVKQPTYGKKELSNSLRYAFYDFLEKEYEVYVYTSNDGVESDVWEIEISAGLKLAVAELRKNPDALVKYAPECEKDNVKGRAGELADFLEEGLKSAKENGYGYIIIDWY